MLNRLYGWYGKRVVQGGIILVILLVLVGIFVTLSGSDEVTEVGDIQLRVVKTASVQELLGGTSINTIGTVEAIDQASIESEVSGRIVSVSVQLGDSISAGTVIAQIENDRERAAVLQAEGVYESALASAAVSDVSERDAETSLETARVSGLNTYRSSFTTVDDTVRNLVDELFSNPDSQTPGFRLSSLGQAGTLNNERKALEPVLDTWSGKVFGTPSDNETLTLLGEAKRDTERVAAFVDTISQLVSDEDNENAEVNGVTIATYKTRFLTARSNLNVTLQNIENGRSSILNAEESLERAALGSTGTEVSTSDAQVKQALGSLRAAQAALSDTIIRTPISGTVNALNVKAGDFVGARTLVSVIANNNALEITTFVGESDRELIAIGDIVSIEGDIEGRIARISPAVNPETKKIEVEIQTEAENLENGDSVRLNISPSDTNVRTSDTIRIPLTAVKLSSEKSFVFTVENEILIAHEITLGKANGSTVVVENGIERDWEIVLDARGLNDGIRVEVAN